ncbi:MAG: ATPase [Sulfuritalea sp.]|nr:ATPase [Sulfuritalea sp.]
MSERINDAGFRPVRHDQLRQERGHDTYKLGGKLCEPAVCGECGAVYAAGRWTWATRPAEAYQVTCPACRRIRDSYPAGFVRIGGAFFAAHRDEILNLLRHREARERAEHPLSRIIAAADEADGMTITTTDVHLARDLGEALHNAYRGELEFHYNQGENLLRVAWRR